MADEPTQEEDLTLDAQEAGWAFRLEMWATDTLLAYWMYLVGVIAVALALIFFYGQYTNYARNLQKAAAKQVASAENMLDAPVAQLAYLQISGQTLDTDELRATATKLEAIETSGAARVEALLKAAELYRIAGDADAQRGALEGVVSEGIQPFAANAQSALANLDLEGGDGDAAVARLKTVVDGGDGFLAEQASLDLGRVYEHLQRNDDARALYERFLERWPLSPRGEQVRKRIATLGEG